MPDEKRVYWGCTTHNCERGFGGTEEAMPRGWTYCPDCDGELCEITVYRSRAKVTEPEGSHSTSLRAGEPSSVQREWRGHSTGVRIG